MNEYALLAFVVTPLLVTALGWAVAIWTVRSGERDRAAR
jgi:cytochrome c oxidase assembly factor CtaG